MSSSRGAWALGGAIVVSAWLVAPALRARPVIAPQASPAPEVAPPAPPGLRAIGVSPTGSLPPPPPAPRSSGVSPTGSLPPPPPAPSPPRAGPSPVDATWAARPSDLQAGATPRAKDATTPASRPRAQNTSSSFEIRGKPGRYTLNRECLITERVGVSLGAGHLRSKPAGSSDSAKLAVLSMRTSYLEGASSSELELGVGTLVVVVVRDEETVSGGIGLTGHAEPRRARPEGVLLFRAEATRALWFSRSRLSLPAVSSSAGWVL